MTERSIRFYWDQHQSGAADRSWLFYRLGDTRIVVPAFHRPLAADAGRRGAVPSRYGDSQPSACDGSPLPSPRVLTR